MSTEYPRTCVSPRGFTFFIHQPAYTVRNLRVNEAVRPLGVDENGRTVDNRVNFPAGDVRVDEAAAVYEIPNPLPFRGATYISADWAARHVDDPAATIGLAPPPAASMHDFLTAAAPGADAQQRRELFARLPEPVLLALAATSTDPRDLTAIAEHCCRLVHDEKGRPVGFLFRPGADGRPRPEISHHMLFEVVVNNPHLPDDYKEVMVLRPGAQGGSEIVGEIPTGDTHVFEYLRRNSYIPWGHYAANMANDAIRYDVAGLSAADISGLRHLYYQRTFVRLAAAAGIDIPAGAPLTPAQLEDLRLAVTEALDNGWQPPFAATLWGWNYGFDCAASAYRLHASHQMIHQQFALLPAKAEGDTRPGFAPYGCGDLVAEVVRAYADRHGSDFFDDYLAAIRANRRLDGRTDLDADLVIHEDQHVILFVPKAQTSQWELQLMPVAPVGHILEADTATRAALDRAMRVALRTLRALGARMITSIEFPKRLVGGPDGQRLLYSFLPKLPYAPGAFSEAEHRWINSHFPEDFARACRAHLAGD